MFPASLLIEMWIQRNSVHHEENTQSHTQEWSQTKERMSPLKGADATWLRSTVNGSVIL